MQLGNILWRNVKWRYANAFTIVITILQPMLWLILYSLEAGPVMKMAGIDEYSAFIMPGLFVLVSFGACSSSGIMNYLRKRDGSFYRTLISPVKRESIVMAQMLEASLCSLLEACIMFGVGVILFQVEIKCSLIGGMTVIALILMTALFMSGITYTISMYLPNEIIFETVMNAIVLPLFFVSSALFPTGDLPQGVSICIKLNPFTHVIDRIREILAGEHNEKYLIQTILLFLVLDIVSFGLANHSLKRETKI